MKKIHVTISAFLFVSIFTLQTLGAQRQWSSKISNSIEVVIGVDLGFRQMSTNNPMFESQLINRKRAESFKFNYNTGLNFNFGLTRKLAAKTGVRFSNPGFSISKVEKIEFSKDINEVIKMPLGSGDKEGSFTYNVHYNLVQVPLGIKYIAEGGFCKPYFELGMLTSFYGKTRVTEFDYYDERTDINLDENINRVNFISFIGVGGNYTISDNVSAFTQISANYQLNSLRIDAVDERLMSVGFAIGVKQYLQ